MLAQTISTGTVGSHDRALHQNTARVWQQYSARTTPLRCSSPAKARTVHDLREVIRLNNNEPGVCETDGVPRSFKTSRYRLRHSTVLPTPASPSTAIETARDETHTNFGRPSRRTRPPYCPRSCTNETQCFCATCHSSSSCNKVER